MPFSLRYLFPLIHSSAHFIDFGKRNDRNGKPVSICLVNKIDISELVPGQNLTADISHIFFEIEVAAGYIVIAFAAKFFSRGCWIAFKGHLVYFLTVWELHQITVRFDCRQNKTTCSVNRSVSAQTPIRKQ